MIAGGSSSRNHPTIWVRRGAYQLSQRVEDPTAACRPFDLDRDGMIHGEGAGAFVLESREHAEARGAKILARILGFSSTFEPHRPEQPLHGHAIRAAIRQAVARAGLQPSDIGHVNADGLRRRSTTRSKPRRLRDVGRCTVTGPEKLLWQPLGRHGPWKWPLAFWPWKRRDPPTLNYSP